MKLSEVNDFDLQKFHQTREAVEREISTQVAAALKITRFDVVTAVTKVTPRGETNARTVVNLTEHDGVELLGVEFYKKHVARIISKILRNNPSIIHHEIIETATTTSHYPHDEAKHQIIVKFTFTL